MEPFQIAFFGATNSGKSTLVNALAGQDVSLVSAVPGTTTDPVRKRMELPGIGACVLVDTAGYGDEGELGAQRERLTRSVIDGTDVAVLLRSGHPADDAWEAMLRKAGVPVVSLMPGDDRASLLERIVATLPQEEHKYLTGKLVKPGDTVLLVMPQDSEAPKGRLILPQQQAVREALDAHALSLVVQPQEVPTALATLRRPPDLVVTDSQAFEQVAAAVPTTIPLTSFSVLFARLKGDLATLAAGAAVVDQLQDGDRILVAEACTHHRQDDDIGTVKIPRWLRAKTGKRLLFEHCAGNGWPEDLAAYALVVHCGACMLTRREMLSRLETIRALGVPVVNYGILIAKLLGIHLSTHVGQPIIFLQLFFGDDVV